MSNITNLDFDFTAPLLFKQPNSKFNQIPRNNTAPLYRRIHKSGLILEGDCNTCGVKNILDGRLGMVTNFSLPSQISCIMCNGEFITTAFGGSKCLLDWKCILRSKNIIEQSPIECPEILHMSLRSKVDCEIYDPVDVIIITAQPLILEIANTDTIDLDPSARPNN